VGTTEVCEEVAVGDDGRVVDDLDRLGVAADVAVGRTELIAAGVADAGLDDTRETPEPGVRTPESTECEDGGAEAAGVEGSGDVAGGAEGG
jgi:hypothetical protein